MAGKFGRFAPTMVANGSGRKSRGNPLKNFYIKRNPDDDADDDATFFDAPASKPSAETSAAKPSSGKKRGRPAGVKNKVKEAVGENKEAVGEKKTKKASSGIPRAVNNLTLKEILALVGQAGKTTTSATASAKHEKYPKLKIEFVGGVAKKKAKKKDGEATVSTGARRGRPPMTAEQKAERKAAREAALVRNGSRRRFRRNPDETPETTEKKKADSKKMGPYLLTLVKNPVMDFKIGGVKVVPAAAAAAGTIALSHFVKNISFVAKMQDGYVKTLMPAGVVLGGAAAVAYFAKKYDSELGEDIAADMATFAIFLGINDVVGAAIATQVDKFRSPESAPATQPSLPAETTPVTKGFSGGRFAQQMSGGAWAGADQLNGYISGARSSGYPQMTGSSGYPPAIEFSTEMMGSADGVNTAAGLVNQMNGGRFSQALAGLDMGQFAE